MRETPIVAMVYDFDKTLSPRDMQEYSFIPALNMRPEAFWEACRTLALEDHMDGVLAYMLEMCRRARLTREDLARQGGTIEFFPGVETWFARINAFGAHIGAQVEHYIISSGLKEIIEGSRISDAFKEVFAASFVYDESGVAVWPATAVNYTSKTQYLFRINKGILDVTNDRDLNAYTPEHMRRVPFSNMIYVGDGLTDVPCMKLTKLKGGYSVVVHAPDAPALADDMLRQNRADFAVPADYSEGSEMEKCVRAMLRRIKAKHDFSVLHEAQMERARSRET